MATYTFGYTFDAETVEEAQERLEELIATEGAGDPIPNPEEPAFSDPEDRTVTFEFPVQVTVPADDRALPRTHQILSERLSYDEQYADADGTEYDYTVNWG